MFSSFTVLMHHDDLREIYQTSKTATGQVMLILKREADTDKVEDRLRRVLAKEGYRLMDKEANPFWMKFDRVSGESWTGQKIDVTTWRDETAFMKWELDLLHAITLVLGLILLVIVVLGLVNTIWIAIRERTSEVGTLRAIGLQKGAVVRMFFTESLLLAVAGAGTGVLAGVLFCTALNAIGIPLKSEAVVMFLMASELHFAVRFSDLSLVFVLVVVFLSCGALIPAWRAGRLRPVTAINHVE